MTAQSYERKVADSHGLKRTYLKFQLDRVLKKEGKYCRRADQVFPLNQKDKKLIQDRYGVSDCKVLNPYYGIEDSVLEDGGAEEQSEGKREPYTICFFRSDGQR